MFEFFITAIVVIGFVFVGLSFYRWSHEERPKAEFAGTGGTERDVWRGAMFGIWLILLPLIFLIQWLWNDTPANMQVYQYGHKVWSDLWAALSIVLGVLFGVKKF